MGSLWSGIMHASTLFKVGMYCAAIAVCTLLFAKFGSPSTKDPKAAVLWSTCDKLTSLSYPLEDGRYGVGWDDCHLAVFLGLCLLGIRSLMGACIWFPLAKSVGIEPTKFELQGWQFSYYLCSWPWGFYLYYHSEYFLDNDPLFRGFPMLQMDPMFKLFYLTQTAFWIQMVAVTVSAEKEKDFWQMMAHHFVAIGLTVTSYYMGYAKVGHLILVNQDTADILLPFAKMLRYAKFTMFDIEMCDVVFAAFAVVWIITRHGVYFWIISHIYWHAVPTLREEGTLGSPYGSEAAINIFLVALGILQGLLLFWLVHLLKAVYAAIFVGTSNIEISTDNYDDRKERKEK